MQSVGRSARLSPRTGPAESVLVPALDLIPGRTWAPSAPSHLSEIGCLGSPVVIQGPQFGGRWRTGGLVVGASVRVQIKGGGVNAIFP